MKVAGISPMYFNYNQRFNNNAKQVNFNGDFTVSKEEAKEQLLRLTDLRVSGDKPISLTGKKALFTEYAREFKEGMQIIKSKFSPLVEVYKFDAEKGFFFANIHKIMETGVVGCNQFGADPLAIKVNELMEKRPEIELAYLQGAKTLLDTYLNPGRGRSYIYGSHSIQREDIDSQYEQLKACLGFYSSNHGLSDERIIDKLNQVLKEYENFYEGEKNTINCENNKKLKLPDSFTTPIIEKLGLE